MLLESSGRRRLEVGRSKCGKAQGPGSNQYSFRFLSLLIGIGDGERYMGSGMISSLIEIEMVRLSTVGIISSTEEKRTRLAAFLRK